MATNHCLRLKWQVASASVPGAAHIRSWQPCQDCARYRTDRMPGTPGDALIAAVADGAGSAPYSEQGSCLAADASVNTANELLLQHRGSIDQDALQDILAASIATARCRLDETASHNDHRIGQYATTLLLAIYVNGTLGAAQVGDGAVVAGGDNIAYELVTTPDRGEYTK